MLIKLLNDNGYQVIGEATNGEEGVELYKELEPDIVTLDIDKYIVVAEHRVKKTVVQVCKFTDSVIHFIAAGESGDRSARQAGQCVHEVFPDSDRQPWSDHGNRHRSHLSVLYLTNLILLFYKIIEKLTTIIF